MLLPDEEFNEPIDSIELKDALALAAYIEQLLMTEQQWILNRLSWLFTSQSFLLTAFVVLLSSGNHSPAAHLLRFALPLLGLFCCITVALAIRAAERVGKPLGNRRAFLSMIINDRIKAQCWFQGLDQLRPSVIIHGHCIMVHCRTLFCLGHLPCCGFSC
jgi:hypothetical protein